MLISHNDYVIYIISEKYFYTDCSTADESLGGGFLHQNIIYRRSVENDKEQLERLFKESFGMVADTGGALSTIEDRYVVAELVTEDAEGKDEAGYRPRIIAASGILPVSRSEYCGYEITWTCTTKEYRKKGIIVEILKQCERELPDDHLPIYCDCWRIKDNEHINMVSVMKHLGMQEVIRGRIKRVYPHNKSCVGCIYAEEECYCHGDLYIKNR